MKKLFTLFAGIACAVAINAQDFTVTVNDAVVADGSTVTVGDFNDEKGYWTSEPHCYVTSSEDATVTLQAQIPTLGNGNLIQFCPGGLCREPNASGIAAAELKMKKDEPVSLETHCDLFGAVGQPVCPEVKASVEITVISRMKPVFSFTLVFDSSYTAGIEGVTGDGNFVNLVAGNILEYNLPEATKLDIYSVNGSTVLERVVNGHGSLSLDRLPAGVYLYKAANLSGKVLVK